MAIFHFSTKTVSRSSGRSATAAAAYRAGEKIKDERTGEIHDYSRKAGVVSSHILLPDHAPEWAKNRADLWNAAEKAETRKNSCVAREFEVALTGKTPEERERQALEFARKIVDKHGCAVDVCLHEPSRAGDQRNYHAHILLTTRRLGSEGFTEKTRELDAKATRGPLIVGLRKEWADGVNELEEKAGSPERVSHLSNAAQGKAEEPGIKMGPAATAYERRTGEASDKRLNHEAQVSERLQAAQEAGWLERKLAKSNKRIIDLDGNLKAAIRERDKRLERERAERKRKAAAEKEKQEREAKQKPMTPMTAGVAEWRKNLAEQALAYQKQQQEQAAAQRWEKTLDQIAQRRKRGQGKGWDFGPGD